MRLLPSRESSSLAIAGLVAVNAVPVVGVLFFDWQLYTLLVIYWLESGIIGALNLPKILLASGSAIPDGFTAKINGRDVDLSGPSEPRPELHFYAENGNIAGFFLLHYGLFWVVHGVFVLSVFAPPLQSGAYDVWTVGLAVLGMVVSHAGSFLTNFVGNAEYQATSPGIQMKEPYRRVIVLHLTIVLGAFAVTLVGSPLGALLLLIGLKTVADLHAHLKEHGRAAQRGRAERSSRQSPADVIEVR